MVSLLMPVKQFFPKQLKLAIIDGTLWKVTYMYLEYVYDFDH